MLNVKGFEDEPLGPTILDQVLSKINTKEDYMAFMYGKEVKREYLPNKEMRLTYESPPHAFLPDGTPIMFKKELEL